MLPGMEQFALTERAAARIAEIVSAEGRTAGLRVAVLAGGCSGLQYRFELDDTAQPDDLVIERGPAKVLVDPVEPRPARRCGTRLHRRTDGQPLRGPQPER